MEILYALTWALNGADTATITFNGALHGFNGNTPETSFLLKRNVPNDPNKMISKVCGCKMGQGEWHVFS